MKKDSNPFVVKDLSGKIDTGYKKHRFYKPPSVIPTQLRFSEDRASFYKKSVSPVELYDYDPDVTRESSKVYSFSKIGK